MLTASGEANAILPSSVAASSSSAAAASSSVTLQNDAVKGVDDFKVVNELGSIESMNKFPMADNSPVTVLSTSQHVPDSDSISISCMSNANFSRSFFSSYQVSAIATITTVDSSASIESASELPSIHSALSDTPCSLFDSAESTGNSRLPDNAVKASSSTNAAVIKRRRRSIRIKTTSNKSLNSATVNDLLQVDIESRGEVPPLKTRAKCLFESGPTGAEMTPIAVPVLERNAFNSDAEWSAYVQEQDHALAVFLQQQQLRRKVPKKNEKAQYNLRSKKSPS